MADEKTRKAIEKAATTLRIRNMAARNGKLTRPRMRPHTWVFLQSDLANPESVICLGIVFTIWNRKKYNSVRFSAELQGQEITSSGRLTKLSNDQEGIIISERWCWESLLKEFRGLSAGDL